MPRFNRRQLNTEGSAWDGPDMRIDGSMPDAKGLRLRGVHRDISGNIIGGTDALTGNQVSARSPSGLDELNKPSEDFANAFPDAARSIRSRAPGLGSGLTSPMGGASGIAGAVNTERQAAGLAPTPTPAVAPNQGASNGAMMMAGGLGVAGTGAAVAGMLPGSITGRAPGSATAGATPPAAAPGVNPTAVTAPAATPLAPNGATNPAGPAGGAVPSPAKAAPLNPSMDAARQARISAAVAAVKERQFNQAMPGVTSHGDGFILSKYGFGVARPKDASPSLPMSDTVNSGRSGAMQPYIGDETGDRSNEFLSTDDRTTPAGRQIGGAIKMRGAPGLAVKGAGAADEDEAQMKAAAGTA